MDEDSIYTPPNGPPPPSETIRTLYSKWGETKIRELVSVFYDLIASSEIKWMFPEELTLAKEKQGDFIIQVLGGPSLYVQKWGPARMRQRHFAFPISEKERLVWFDCYDKALEQFPFDHEDKIDFLYFLDGFSQWMVNRK
jgi:hemoglobin